MEQNREMAFGVFTDLHYSRRPNDEIRYFERSMEKLKLCLDLFQRRNVDFLICLGDLVDHSREDEDVHGLFDRLGPVLNSCLVPRHLCLGNHDVGAFPYKELLRMYGSTYRFGYYSFERGGVHFIILNTNYGKDGRHYTHETMKWDELYVDDRQLQWLQNDLEASCMPVVLFSHGNLDFRETEGKLDQHVVRNYKEVQHILHQSGKVRLVLQGHCHTGAYSIQSGVPYITLKALVDGRLQAPTLIVACKDSGKTYTLDFCDAAAPEDEIRLNIRFS